jgi:hypothetical protein
MIPIAYCIDKLRRRYVGAFRVLDDQGLGTDEVLFCETPVRTTRAHAIADAIATLAALNA